MWGSIRCCTVSYGGEASMAAEQARIKHKKHEMGNRIFAGFRWLGWVAAAEDPFQCQGNDAVGKQESCSHT